MTSLRAYQRELLTVLADPASPRVGVVTSVPGAGIRRAIEIHIRAVASTSLVLVLCPTRLLVDHWAERLRTYEDIQVTVLDSASAALGLLEGRTGHQQGAVVATYARAQHGPSSRAISELDLGLVLHDQPPRSLSNDVERLNVLAQRTILIVDRQQRVFWAQWPLLWDMSSEDLMAGGYIAPIGVSVESTAEERAQRDEAVALLKEHALRQEVQLVLPSNSRPELHARLLRLASDPLGDVDLADRAWALIDRMESSRATDSRLAALDRIMQEEISTNARCVVMTATVTDANYVAHHLVNAGKAPRAVLSGAVSLSERRAALAGLGPGECIVSTHVTGASADGWPADSKVILWPSPANRRVLEDLYLTAEDAPDVTVLELSETNDAEAPAL